MAKIVNTSGINGGQTDFTSVYPVAIVNDDGYTILGSNDFLPVGVASGSASIPVSQSGNFYVEQSGTWIVQQGNAPWTVNAIQSGTWAVQASQPSGESYQVQFASPQYDAFGRIRVSESIGLFSSQQPISAQPLLYSREIVSGTVTHSPTDASSFCSVQPSGYAVCKSFQSMLYSPSKSQQIFQTFSYFAPQADVIKRVGYFSSSYTPPYTANLDGLFWQSSGTDVSVNCYRYGTQVFSVPQSQWNIDKMDGNGPSGKTVNWNNTNLTMMTFGWLGVSSVEWALIFDGEIFPVHTEPFTNTSGTVYMSSPNQPVRYEVRNNAPSGTAELNVICSAVNSEAGWEPRFQQLSIDNFPGATGPNSNIEWCSIALRIDSSIQNSHGINTLLEGVEVASTANAQGIVRIKLDPTIAGSLSWLPTSISGLQYAIGSASNTTTGGQQLVGGLFTAQTRVTTQQSESLSRIGVGVSGNAQVLAVCHAVSANNALVVSSLDLQVAP